MFYKYKQGDKIYYDNGVICGYGIVVGISTSPQPIIGTGYIIEPIGNISTPTYPYSHFVCFEHQIKQLN